jgi:hypothetical protein
MHEKGEEKTVGRNRPGLLLDRLAALAYGAIWRAALARVASRLVAGACLCAASAAGRAAPGHAPSTATPAKGRGRGAHEREGRADAMGGVTRTLANRRPPRHSSIAVGLRLVNLVVVPRTLVRRIGSFNSNLFRLLTGGGLVRFSDLRKPPSSSRRCITCWGTAEQFCRGTAFWPWAGCRTVRCRPCQSEAYAIAGNHSSVPSGHAFASPPRMSFWCPGKLILKIKHL